MRQISSRIFFSDRFSFWKLHLLILILIILLVLTIYYPRNFERSGPLWNLMIFEFGSASFGILFIIPLIYAAIFLNVPALIVTWLVCGALMAPRITDLSFHADSLLRAYTVYTLPFLVAMFVKTEIIWRRKERASAAEKEEQRQRYLSQVFKAHENERKNIARELHDGVIQSLIVLTNYAQSLISNKNPVVSDLEPKREIESMVKQVVTLRDMSRDISKDIRNICLNLRPYLIDDMGLISALKWLINRTKAQVDITLTTDGEERRLNPETELMIYRILQEAISNINNHSMATKANICFHFNKDGLKISIDDNGKGFAFPGNTSRLAEEGKLGLIGMQERVKFLNGDIKILSQPGQGTSITISASL